MDYSNFWEEHKRRDEYYRLRYSRIHFDIQGKVLDVGGGNGQFLYYIGVREGTIVDIAGLEEARTRGFKTIKADIRDWTDYGSYDVIFCFETLEHFTKLDSIHILNNIYYNMKKGAVLYLGVPNCKTDDAIGHLYRWFPDDLMRTVKSVGFKIEEFQVVPAFIEKQRGIYYLLYLVPFWFKKLVGRFYTKRGCMIAVLKCSKR